MKAAAIAIAKRLVMLAILVAILLAVQGHLLKWAQNQDAAGRRISYQPITRLAGARNWTGSPAEVRAFQKEVDRHNSMYERAGGQGPTEQVQTLVIRTASLVWKKYLYWVPLIWALLEGLLAGYNQRFQQRPRPETIVAIAFVLVAPSILHLVVKGVAWAWFSKGFLYLGTVVIFLALGVVAGAVAKKTTSGSIRGLLAPRRPRPEPSPTSDSGIDTSVL